MRRTSLFASALAGVLALVGVTAGLGGAAAPAKVVAPKVISVNKNVTAFYFGRGVTPPSPVSNVKGNWVDMGSWDLGQAVYAVHNGRDAILYDALMLPQEAVWVRNYLTRKKGIENLVVVLSHWHLDHVGGTTLFPSLIALEETRDYLAKNEKAIEKGTLWGPPALELELPDITFEGRLDIYLGKLKVEFHQFNIHSRDQNVMVIPSQKLMFPADALEDTVTYMVEPEAIPTHIAELKRMRKLDVTRIYPNHGDPAVIARGGYTKAFVDAVREYDVNMLRKVKAQGYLDMAIEDFIPVALKRKAVSVWEPYRAVHTNNLKLVHGYWKNRPLPKVG